MNRKNKVVTILAMMIFAVMSVSCATNVSANNCDSLDAANKLVNGVDGYCFSMPGDFESTSLSEGLVTIAPMANTELAEAQVLSANGQPVAPQLTIINLGPANGRSASDLAEERFAQYASANLKMVWGTVKLGNEEAITIESRPGELLTRKAFVVHNDIAFELTLSPLDENMPAESAAAEALWQNVVQKFSFYTP